MYALPSKVESLAENLTELEINEILFNEVFLSEKIVLQEKDNNDVIKRVRLMQTFPYTYF